MYVKNNEYLNKGTLIADPEYPEDGVAMIMEVDLSRIKTCKARRGWSEIYRVHCFQGTASNCVPLWLHKEYVESCTIIYSTGKTFF